MKNAFAFLLCGICWMITDRTYGQELGRSEAASAEQRLAEDLGPEWRNTPAPGILELQNLSRILQQGDGNEASSTQNNSGRVANQAYITQVGEANKSFLTQIGSGNTTRIEQDGDDNEATSSVTGDGNTTLLRQEGYGNTIIREVITDNADFTLTQQGTDNRIIQRGAQNSAPPTYEIEMRGNGIQLTVEQGRIGQ